MESAIDSFAERRASAGHQRPGLMLFGYVAMVTLCLPSIGAAQATRGMDPQKPYTVVIGQVNPKLYEGAQALLKGDAENGVRLTLIGLKDAQGERQTEVGLSNLCAGYLLLAQYQSALLYCDMVLQRNDKNWRAYNNRAVIYIKTKQYESAGRDLDRGEALRPGAHTLKVARAMYLDAVSPVTPEVEVDDRQTKVENAGDAQ